MDVYASDRPGNLSPAVQNFPPRVYVPNSKSNTVTVIDPATFQVIDTFRVGRLPQHVTPSYDMKTLWVLNDKGNSLTRVDPATGKPKETIPVDDPYNMYYTPDGKYAIVVAEQRRRLNFLSAADMKLYHSLPVPCKGVDHMDFSADGKYLIASCEFEGSLIKVDVERQQLLGRLRVLYVSNRGEGSVSLIDFGSRKEVAKWRIPGGGSPDMGGISADGKVLWLAGRYNSEVYAIDTRDGKLLARIPVGREPHGLCVYPQPGRYSLGHTGIFR
jgi:YVTN family beta-propeller protein